MREQKRILYIGSLEKQCNSFKRFQTLIDMGYEVEGIDVDPYVFVPFWLRFHYHLNVGPGINKLNNEVLKKVDQFRPDILWVDNKPYLRGATLKQVKQKYPGTQLANIITDDPCGKYSYCWRSIYHTFKHYDIQFVQREVNIAELTALGSKRVEICYRSFDPSFHRPLPNLQQQRNREPVVGFIGSYEEDREEYIAYLVQQGIRVEITGNGWPEGKYWSILQQHYKGPSVYGDAYIETINKMDIALHFLRKANRDQQDSRTFEIPACGVFMLAERSHLHLDLFAERSECDFFTSKEELLQKVKYYIVHPEKRNAMAQRAYQRSFNSGYDHRSRLEYILDRIYQSPLPAKKYQRIVTAIYYDPDFYPPTINAILNLAPLCNELVVVTRNNNSIDFPYPSNVQLVKTGRYTSVMESEQKPVWVKMYSFIQFTFRLWFASQWKKADLVVYYDAIPLLSYYLTSMWSRKKQALWYHNHDMPGTQQLSRFSIGRLAQRKEHPAMKRMHFFSLPSEDRLAFYPNWNPAKRYATIPNFPSLKVYHDVEHHQPEEGKEIRIIYQGTMGNTLALESVLQVVQQQPFHHQIKLVLKGAVRAAYKEELLKHIHHLGIENNIEWHGLGPYRELPEITASCHIGLAIYMGTDNVKKTLGTASNKIYEYAACGLPVIVYDNEQFRKYLSKYPWAFFTDGTPASIQNCMASILANYDLLAKEARNSFERELNFEQAFSTVIGQLD